MRNAINRVVFLVIVLIVNVCNDNNDSTLIEQNPYKFISEQLVQKKIIMLGDYDHHNSYSYDALLRVMHDWLDLASKSKNKDNLTIILEHDSIWNNRINEYLSTDNLSPLIFNLINDLTCSISGSKILMHLS